jgi:hypothetical protein
MISSLIVFIIELPTHIKETLNNIKNNMYHNYIKPRFWTEYSRVVGMMLDKCNVDSVETYKMNRGFKPVQLDLLDFYDLPYITPGMIK